jgi:hypothetical protein
VGKERFERRLGLVPTLERTIKSHQQVRARAVSADMVTA